jgi:hypothetical protein
MGFFNKDNLKKGLKYYADKIAPPKSPDQLAYEKQVRDATEKARKDSYLKEAIKQSHIKGRQEAIKKYNTPKADPLKNLANFGSNLSAGLQENHLGKKSDLKKKMKKDDAFNKLMFGG